MALAGGREEEGGKEREGEELIEGRVGVGSPEVRTAA